MAKINRSGQAAILSETDQAKIRKVLQNKQHRLFWDIAVFTGERWGAICQLQVGDVYQNAYRAELREEITFRAKTRKADTHGRRYTRQVPVHPHLQEILEHYRPPLDAYLFPSPITLGRPITQSSAEAFFKRAIAKAGLDSKGYSTHSTRRTFITRLYRNGCDVKTLQQLTGHRDITSLMRYIELTPDRAKAAISLL